jgi:hypothetical protein
MIKHGVGVFVDLVLEAPSHDDGMVENEVFAGLAGTSFDLIRL